MSEANLQKGKRSQRARGNGREDGRQGEKAIWLCRRRQPAYKCGMGKSLGARTEECRKKLCQRRVFGKELPKQAFFWKEASNGVQPECPPKINDCLLSKDKERG